MAVLPQQPIAPDGLTVEELAAFGRFPYKKGFGTLGKDNQAIIDRSLKACQMEGFRNRPLKDLSGGQRQRAWIAMTLCQNTDGIVLDEPTTYLDLSHQLEILSLLDKLNKEENRTIVMVLHELNIASRFAGHMIGMKDGQIVAPGHPKPS
ncbi:MAG: ABC transporter ATP-binding protein [Turicibacter sp.]|nr:ABC transporter ATP-binding protein [Turicibacter sp.]